MRKVIVILYLAIIATNALAQEDFSYLNKYDFMVDGLAYKILSKNTVAVTHTFETKYLDVEDSRIITYPDLHGEVIIPSKVVNDGTTYRVTEVSICAFYGCNFDKIVLNSGIAQIGDYAFKDCKLKEISLPSTLEKIGECAFMHSGLNEVIIPNSVKTINDAFYSCENLKMVSVGAGVTYCAGFYGCRSLEVVYWNVKKHNPIINEYWFADDASIKGNKHIKYFYFGDKVEEIPAYLLQGLSSIESIELPDGLKTIGKYAFSNCSSIQKIDIPNSV